MSNPPEILHLAFQRAFASYQTPIIQNADTAEKINQVCRNIQNKAGARLLLACALAKVHNPSIDIRKPYTEINTSDAYSGRTYDEQHITEFVNQHKLPCNPTTAFLTPALRNRNMVLALDVDLVGRPPQLYRSVLYLLNDVFTGQVTAEDLLAETIRCLLIVRDEKENRLNSLLANLRASEGAIPLSSEGVVNLITQHLACPKSSRLPVLVVAAAYQAASEYLKERVLPLASHNAADEQTGALGDVEITLINEENIVTCYEMKTKRVIRNDIERALQKITASPNRIDNYIFITTEPIDEIVQEYAKGLYEQTGGVEVVILDCISFLRHFLHLFHRIRGKYLNAYQELVLNEPDSAVSQPLKEAFLALRQAAEST